MGVVLPAISYGQYWDLFYNDRVLSDEKGRLIQSVTKWDTLRKADRKAIRKVKIIGGIKPAFGVYDSVLEAHSFNKQGQGVLTKASTSWNVLSQYASSCNDSFYKEAYTAQSNISYTDSVSWADVLEGQGSGWRHNLNNFNENPGFFVFWDRPSGTLSPIDSMLSILDISMKYEKQTRNEEIRSHKLLGYYDSTHTLRRFEGTLNHIKVFGSTNRIGPSSYIGCLYNKYIMEFDVSYYNTHIDRIILSFPRCKAGYPCYSEPSDKVVDFFTMDIYKKQESIKAILHMAVDLYDNITGFYTIFYIPKPFVKGSAVRLLHKYPGDFQEGIIKTTF